MNQVLEILNFNKSYGKFSAVKNMNLTIEQGEIVGFVGKNGAGKSTTIRAITNMIFPTSGKIEVFGLDSIKNAIEIKKRMSYIPSDSAFYGNVNSRELFNLCLKFCDSTMEEVDKLATEFELDLDKKISSLSFGNKKKVSLIQGLLKKADLYILDEPTNGLDPLIQEMFFNKLKKERQRGATIFLSSHNLSEIEKHCDKVVVIKDGVIVDIIKSDTVLKEKKHIVRYQINGCDIIEKEIENNNFNNLIKELSALDIIDLSIRQTSIEEDFMKFYESVGGENEEI